MHRLLSDGRAWLFYIVEAFNKKQTHSIFTTNQIKFYHLHKRLFYLSVRLTLMK